MSRLAYRTAVIETPFLNLADDPKRAVAAPTSHELAPVMRGLVVASPARRRLH